MIITFTDYGWDDPLYTALKGDTDFDYDGNPCIEIFKVSLRTLYEDLKKWEESGDFSVPYPKVRIQEIALLPEDDLYDKYRSHELDDESFLEAMYGLDKKKEN